MKKQCGTCKFFAFGMRAICTWKWTPGAKELSTAYKAGGENHAMWVDDGKNCPTYEQSK